MMVESNFEDLEGLAVHTILKKLGPKDTVRVGCVSKRFRVLAEDESLWSHFYFEDLQLSSPVDPFSNPSPTFKEAYRLWRDSFSMYPWHLVLRVKRCWDRLKGWLKVNYPEADASLRNGASELDISEAEKTMKVKLPLPTRVLYRFVDGQELSLSSRPPANAGASQASSLAPCGLIGGYTFYDHIIDVYLLPLRAVSLFTDRLNRRIGIHRFTRRSSNIVVALSCTSSEKFFFLNCTNSQLYVGTRNLLVDGEMMPCVPPSLLSEHNQQDALLLWLEEHCRRLESGIISVRKHHNIKTICHYPEQEPFCSTAITSGVKIRASSVFVPELSDLQSDVEKQWFSYSIRMSLVPEGCVVSGMKLSSCQLYRRHWIIRAGDNVVSDVNGEGVIGEYPLLHPGESEYVYESCSSLPATSGSIEGFFTFVPGRLSDPRGSQFDVAVAQFPLRVPDFIF